MRRVGNLMEKISDYDNIQLAFVKACRGKQGKTEVKEFLLEYEKNISGIMRDMIEDTIEIGNYKYFKIYDPKERMICAATFRERVIHHAIMSVCHEYFDRSLIDDTYATRKGKGVYAALGKAVKNASEYEYVVKLDYRKYFDSIDHKVLKSQLAEIFKDEALLKLFNKIIDSYHSGEGKGLPIGNLTSQYFANHYLSKMDHCIKERLQVPCYIRYMDDMILMGNDKQQLKKIVDYMIEYSNIDLKLTLKSPLYRKTKVGVPFLGYIVKPHYMKLSGRSKRRFARKFRRYTRKFENRLITEQEYQNHSLPLLSFTSYAQCRMFRHKCIREIEE